MLHRGQYRVNHKRVLRLMKQMGLLVQPRRRKVLATEGKAHEPPFPNLLKGLKIKRPDRYGVRTSPTFSWRTVLCFILLWFWISLPV